MRAFQRCERVNLGIPRQIGMSCPTLPIFPLCLLCFFLLKFYLTIIALRYRIGFMPYIDMTQPQVDVCLLPPDALLSPSSLHRSRLSQGTGVHPQWHRKFPLATQFTNASVHVSMPFPQLVPLLLPHLSTRLVFISAPPCCFANKLISTIFLDSIRMPEHIGFVFLFLTSPITQLVRNLRAMHETRV